MEIKLELIETIAYVAAPFIFGFGFGWELHRAKSLRAKEELLKKLYEIYGKNKEDFQRYLVGKSSDDIIDERLSRKP